MSKAGEIIAWKRGCAESARSMSRAGVHVTSWLTLDRIRSLDHLIDSTYRELGTLTPPSRRTYDEISSIKLFLSQCLKDIDEHQSVICLLNNPTVNGGFILSLTELFDKLFSIIENDGEIIKLVVPRPGSVFVVDIIDTESGRTMYDVLSWTLPVMF
jgi:hypothetical protein